MGINHGLILLGCGVVGTIRRFSQKIGNITEKNSKLQRKILAIAIARLNRQPFFSVGLTRKKIRSGHNVCAVKRSGTLCAMKQPSVKFIRDGIRRQYEGRGCDDQS